MVEGQACRQITTCNRVVVGSGAARGGNGLAVGCARCAGWQGTGHRREGQVGAVTERLTVAASEVPYALVAV